MNSRQIVVSASGVLCAAALIFFSSVFVPQSRAQSQPQTEPQAQDGTAAPKYEYEVASIKPSKDGGGNGAMVVGFRNSPGGFTATGVPLKMLIKMAYGLQDDQLEGMPDWTQSERYEIDAKMDEATAAALQKMTSDERSDARKQMLQALLADRLKLAFHREKKDLPIYSLVIGKNGSKLQEAKAGNDYANGIKGMNGAPGGAGVMRMSMGPDGMTLTAQAMTIAQLCSTLSQSVGREVIDKTGLTAKYDFTLTWAPDQMQGPMGAPPGGGMMGPPPSAPAESSAPPIFEAVQQELGLKLESGKGPADVMVIDHIEKPSEN